MRKSLRKISKQKISFWEKNLDWNAQIEQKIKSSNSVYSIANEENYVDNWNLLFLFVFAFKSWQQIEKGAKKPKFTILLQ